MAQKRKHSNDFEDSEEGYYDEEGGIRIDDIYIPPPPQTLTGLNSTSSRLIITRIVNTNFKSYGEEQHLGPFHKYFNSIVGPNGSGKSNVIDSMLFVFGFRASKIRSKKLSVLIHKSEKYPNLKSCSVAIHFAQIIDKPDDPDAYEVVPDSAFVVSRSVHVDNSSYYLLNDTRVHFKQIASVLRKQGIDLDHNRFLILQGEVEQISLMKPKAQNEHEPGMLEYLEDIIGTSRFKEPLLQIGEKIEVLAQIREEKYNRVKLAENEKNILREPMLEAVHFLKVENEIVKKKNFLYQRQIHQLNGKLTDIQKENEIFLEKENELKESVNELQKEKMEKEKTFSEQNKERENLLKKKEEFTGLFDNANSRDVHLVSEFTEINAKRKKMIEALKEEKITLEKLEKLPERNKSKIVEFSARETELLTKCEALESERERLLPIAIKEVSPLNEKKDKIQTQLISLKAIVDDTKSAFNLAEKNLKVYLSNEENERNKFEKFKTAYEENKQKLTEGSNILKDIKQKLPAIEQQYKKTVAELDRGKIEEARMIDEIKRKRVKVEEFRTSQQANKSRGRVLDALTQQKVNGNLPGLFGRLGDLGGIAEKYDIAVSTACGALDNIVVDTVPTAQLCIKFLRDHDIGQATFIALDKQEHLRKVANSKITTPENVPRLYDLIKVEDDRFRTAFYFALRDTLVANDIDQATRIAYGTRRYRVVTLKGDLIETSGTMSGGGKRVSKGRMGQQVAVQCSESPQKIRDLESTLNKLEQKARELNGKQAPLEDEVNKLENELRSIDTDFRKYSNEVQYLQQRLPDLERDVNDQKKKLENSYANRDQVKLKELQALVANKKEKYDKANKNVEVLQVQIDEITRNINEKMDKKMRTVTTELKEKTTLLQKIKAELVKIRGAIKTAERDEERCKDKINNMENRKTQAENKLHAIQKERQELEIDAAKIMERIDKITNELNEMKDSDEQKVITELNEALNKLEEEKLEFDKKIKALSKIIKESKEMTKRVQITLSQLQLNDIPDETLPELRKYTNEELEETDTKRMEIDLKREEDEIKNLRPRLAAIAEYKQKEANYEGQSKELLEITMKGKQMKKLRENLRKDRHREFQAGFNVISTKLKEMYQLITLGGDAELELVDSYDPFTEGVVLNVRPPKKSWKNITNLSGGEKTLTSLALVFALHYYKPSPLYFMDEIDAALDFKNVSIIGYYIKEQTKNAQFIIVSLRPNMFELADHLIGIYKTHNITKSVAFNPRKFEENRKNEMNLSQKSVSVNSQDNNIHMEDGNINVQGNTINMKNVNILIENEDNLSSTNATQGSTEEENL